MLIAAVLCLCVAAATAGAAAWSLNRPYAADPVRQVLRAVAPTQFAAAAMLAAGGIVGLVAPAQMGLLVLVVCVIGAIGTVGAGCWQSAKLVALKEAEQDARREAGGGCAGSCGSCSLTGADPSGRSICG
ncbi:hypothetical protein [Mycolicibacterium diernhoferi]|uniref:Transmembrane protein n=1 Tax=Mycolicibacterium diernhoferi TaxID=1801 RepID=A0A1Q4H850_9MYCO|nr:hypothetical protein [Mycolicibacterium diernhoferi]OJZ63645.1 hypothetical protein BRW64_21415 [Mycolicibacterium diernhoferi]OPE48275.1 hypothetical protein BV510_23965 [Mycolicibacterium diernhoferi]PEG53785.1 hypothetical protein CRI78_14360 [Mycolicibacterium diernhoferi]QYL22824.1 hypothetical protein K0O62_00120 [Mycolicibacterium diernhoferi]